MKKSKGQGTFLSLYIVDGALYLSFHKEKRYGPRQEMLPFEIRLLSVTFNLVGHCQNMSLAHSLDKANIDPSLTNGVLEPVERLIVLRRSVIHLSVHTIRLYICLSVRPSVRLFILPLTACVLLNKVYKTKRNKWTDLPFAPVK